MKIQTLFVSILLGLCMYPLHAQSQLLPAREAFDQYLDNAIAFSKAYPREKAYLHFDNTSYYVGDTIWFKAYVTLADQPVPSPISRPLYVEMLNQTGQLIEKQIIKMDGGEGHGQFILPVAMLSGYYEIRAYTRWMLGFEEQQYFSRTFPIYQASKSEQMERSITTYHLNPSMKQRPEQKEKFTIQFFPEGGQLVDGVTSQVAFKAESSEEGHVDVTGEVYSADGAKLTSFETMHDGMGKFAYTPTGEKQAIAKITYKGKKYEFKLPKSLPAGYVMTVNNKPGGFAVEVSCNGKTPQDSLAVFFSHQGKPYAYRPVGCKPGTSESFQIGSRGIPAGIVQISLVNRAGATLCDRFCFISPRTTLNIEPKGLKTVYTPYSPIQCELQVTNAAGEPVQGNLSVSIRDGIRSDFLEYDNNIFTDLLLTSDLKGYIHQPGYYFADASIQRQNELDVLLMVHGWRKYDMSQQFGVKPYEPLQVPEPQLTLHGQVKSVVLKNELKDIELSVVARSDSTFVAGQTVTGEGGRFALPINDFENTMEAVFQTKKSGKDSKKMTSILLDRNFSPDLKRYGFYQSHPEWVDNTKWLQAAQDADSLYLDSIRRVDSGRLLAAVDIIGKRKQRKNVETKIYEQSIDAYYNVQQSVNMMRDEGKEVYTLPELMSDICPQYHWDKTNDSYTYKQKPIRYFLNGKMLTPVEVTMMMTEVDGLQSIFVCEGANAFDGGILKGSNGINVSDVSGSFFQNNNSSDTGSSGTSSSELGSGSVTSNGQRNFDHEDRVNMMELSKFSVFYLIPLPSRDVLNKQQQAARGTRQTNIQGYSKPLEYFSPAYKDGFPPGVEYQRRTLYWNPSLKTDSNGKAVIRCYNGNYSNPVIINAETLVNGAVGTLTYTTIK